MYFQLFSLNVVPPCKLFWWRVRWYFLEKFLLHIEHLCSFSETFLFFGTVVVDDDADVDKGLLSNPKKPEFWIMCGGGGTNIDEPWLCGPFSCNDEFPWMLYELFGFKWFRISIWLAWLWASSRCLLRNSGREKRLPQIWQLKLCSGVNDSNAEALLCKLFMWRVRWSFFENDLLHSWQTGRFLPSTIT